MLNIAGNKKCDLWILDELKIAGIEIVREDPHATGEVPATISGKLGGFTFRRAWCYWIVDGPMPLDIASRLYESNEVWKKEVRVEGHGGAPHPKEWAIYYDAERAMVECFHIDSRAGLSLFADTVRSLVKSTATKEP